MASLPTRSGRDVYALDLGANVEASPEQLLQFAIMGSLAVSAIHDKAKPRVGLLNVGTEEIKGNSTVKAAAELLQEIKLFEYGGFVEGDAIFSSSMDVIVCDGFVGNVALKTGEGITKLIGHFAKQEFGRNFLTKIAASVAYPVIKRLVARIDPRVRNGASLLGLNGIVIKSHGRSDALAFRHAIEEARLEVDKQVPALIAEEVARVLAWLDEKNSTTTDVDE
jgi:glycerol-3-phosphate acyltransferase PlsX